MLASRLWLSLVFLCMAFSHRPPTSLNLAQLDPLTSSPVAGPKLIPATYELKAGQAQKVVLEQAATPLQEGFAVKFVSCHAKDCDAPTAAGTDVVELSPQFDVPVPITDAGIYHLCISYKHKSDGAPEWQFTDSMLTANSVGTDGLDSRSSLLNGDSGSKALFPAVLAAGDSLHEINVNGPADGDMLILVPHTASDCTGASGLANVTDTSAASVFGGTVTGGRIKAKAPTDGKFTACVAKLSTYCGGDSDADYFLQNSKNMVEFGSGERFIISRVAPTRGQAGASIEFSVMGGFNGDFVKLVPYDAKDCLGTNSMKSGISDPGGGLQNGKLIVQIADPGKYKICHAPKATGGTLEEHYFAQGELYIEITPTL